MRTLNATVYVILLATVLLSAEAFAQLEDDGMCDARAIEFFESIS